MTNNYPQILAMRGLVQEHKARSADPLDSVPEHLRPVVAALQDLPGLQLDIRGTWLWVSGDTYPVKDAIKASGCKWASRKRMWFCKPAFAAL